MEAFERRMMFSACAWLDVVPSNACGFIYSYSYYYTAHLDALEQIKMERKEILDSRAQELTSLFYQLDDALNTEQVFSNKSHVSIQCVPLA